MNAAERKAIETAIGHIGRIRWRSRKYMEPAQSAIDALSPLLAISPASAAAETDEEKKARLEYGQHVAQTATRMERERAIVAVEAVRPPEDWPPASRSLWHQVQSAALSAIRADEKEVRW